MPVEDLTPGAQRALNLAGQEALALHHNFVGTEHLLLGLLAEGGGAARVLQEFGVTLDQLRSLLMGMIPGGETPVRSAMLTPRTERVMGIALGEAEGLGAPQADTLHLLLGLIREGNGIRLSAC